jgi:Protein of unknown function (DUF2635)
MKIKPANPALKIPYEGTLLMLPDDGADVPDTQYWRRRLRDGDVVLVDAPSPPPPRTPQRQPS